MFRPIASNITRRQFQRQQQAPLLLSTTTTLRNNNNNVNVRIQSSLSSSLLLQSFSTTIPSPPLPDGMTTVQDLLVKLTFVDPDGARRKVNGMVGELLFYLFFCVSICSVP